MARLPPELTHPILRKQARDREESDIEGMSDE